MLYFVNILDINTLKNAFCTHDRFVLSMTLRCPVRRTFGFPRYPLLALIIVT